MAWSHLSKLHNVKFLDKEQAYRKSQKCIRIFGHIYAPCSNGVRRVRMTNVAELIAAKEAQ